VIECLRIAHNSISAEPVIVIQNSSMKQPVDITSMKTESIVKGIGDLTA
jgi:hypothetical protein